MRELTTFELDAVSGGKRDYKKNDGGSTGDIKFSGNGNHQVAVAVKGGDAENNIVINTGTVED